MDELTTEQGIVSLLHNEEEGKEEDHLESNMCSLYALKSSDEQDRFNNC